MTAATPRTALGVLARPALTFACSTTAAAPLHVGPTALRWIPPLPNGQADSDRSIKLLPPSASTSEHPAGDRLIELSTLIRGEPSRAVAPFLKVVAHKQAEHESGHDEDQDEIGQGSKVVRQKLSRSNQGKSPQRKSDPPR